MDPHELYTKAKSTLLNRSSPNGLLRTPLHLADKRMENDDEAFLQLYWTDTFEIPYILCKYQERANMHMSQRFTSATTANEPKSRSIPAATPMEFNVQLDNRVDQENVVEISGDWLYDEPKFLGIRPDLSEQAFSKFETENQAVLGNCLKEWHKRSRLYAKEGTKVADENIKCMIYDVARGGQSNASEDTDNKQQKSPQTNSSSLRDRLKAERTRKNAKKRLIQIFQATTTTALHCSLSSVEKKDTALFFNRHSLYHISMKKQQQSRTKHNSTKHDIEIKKLDVTDEMKESHWHQRRILELVLFDRILKGMLKAANGFLKEAKQQVQRSFSPVKKPNTSECSIFCRQS
ncbi:hypothetical protein K4K51_013162 [Colletotrichum sp. SAR 10_75]|nr:hypothetical protein K4K51_013162 [Colletotrichum sp. SAR 10_75]